MPRPAKGARLWLEPEERDRDGSLVRRAAWVIRDGSRKVRTGRARDDCEGAERALVEYLAAKYEVRRERGRHPSKILVLDVLNIYLADKAKDHARPEETKQRVLTLADFWQTYTLADVNGRPLPRVCSAACRATLEIVETRPHRASGAACYQRCSTT